MAASHAQAMKAVRAQALLVAAGHAQAVKASRAHALQTVGNAKVPNGGRPKAVKASHAQAAMSGHAAASRRRMTKAYPRVSWGLIGGGKRRRRWRGNRVRHPGGSLDTRMP